MFDHALLKKEIFVQCPVLCITCDNPKASEICHHLGSSARHFCKEYDVCSSMNLEIYIKQSYSLLKCRSSSQGICIFQ